MNWRLDVDDPVTENSGPRKPPGADVAVVSELEELVAGVRVGVMTGGVAIGVDGGATVDDTVDESTCVLSGTVETSTVATGEPEGSTKVNTARAGVLVGSVTGTTKGIPVSAAWTPGGVESVFIAGGVCAEYIASGIGEVLFKYLG